MRILIADSGASHTDWAYIDNGKPVYMKTSGLHPAYLDPNEAHSELEARMRGVDPDMILFYGAGCHSEEASKPVEALLAGLFGEVQIVIEDDLTAVAHAFLQKGEGIAGILGTGSASGYFKHGKKVEQVASLGYVLGDEGSAADIGKRLLRNVFRHEFSEAATGFLEEILETLEYSEVINRLYTSARPSFYLAGIAESVFRAETPEEIAREFEEVVRESVESYVNQHVMYYSGFADQKVVLSGGVAACHQALIGQILTEHGVEDYYLTGGVITALAELKFERMG